MNKFAIIALSLVTTLSSISSATAFPVTSAPVIATSDVLQVRDDHHHGSEDWHRHGGRSYHGYGRGRGYDRYDRYDHHHSNGGAIIGGLAAGAIIGGLVAGSRSSAGSSHAQSCYNRYRSYRASDNTFKPNSGPRIQCR